MQESHFFGLLLIHQEIDGFALVAQLAFRVCNLGSDIHKIPHLFGHFGLDGQFRFSCGNGLLELDVELCGVTACLKFAGDDPPANARQ